MYEALIAQVHRYGGSVIGFVGDAITCWFDGDQGLRTAVCGLAMQQVMASFAGVEVATEVVTTFTIKVGVASGPVRRFRVGDPQIQYLDVLAGDTLRQMSLAEGLARKGEVLLAPTTGDRFKDAVTVSEWRTHPGTGQHFAVVAELSAARSATGAVR